MSKVKKEPRDVSRTINGLKRSGETILINSRTMIPKSTSKENLALFEVTDLSLINPYSGIVYKDINSLPEKVQDYSRNKRVKWALKSRTLELQAEACMRLIESEQIIVRKLNRILHELSSDDWGQQNISIDITNAFVPHSPIDSSILTIESFESGIDKGKKNKIKPGLKDSLKQNDSSLIEDKDTVIFNEGNDIPNLKEAGSIVSALKDSSGKSTKKKMFLIEERLDPREADNTLLSENNSNVLQFSPVSVQKDVGPQEELVEEQPDTQEATGIKNGLSVSHPEKISVVDYDPLKNTLEHKQSGDSTSTYCSQSNTSFPPIHKSIDNLISKVQASLDHSRHYIHLLQQTRQALIRQSTNNVRLYQELRDTRKVPDPAETSNVIVDIV